MSTLPRPRLPFEHLASYDTGAGIATAATPTNSSWSDLNSSTIQLIDNINNNTNSTRPTAISAGKPLSSGTVAAGGRAGAGPALVGGRFVPTRRFYMTFVAIAIVTLAAATDATSLSTALATITQHLDGTAIEAFWCGTAFLLASAVFQPPFAALSDVLGRKPLLLQACLFFAIGSFLAAMALNMQMLIVGRAIQGVGGGGILCLGEVLVTDLVPLKERGAWMGWLGSMWAIGATAGPLLGGALSQDVSWRWIYWINILLIFVGAMLIGFFLYRKPITGRGIIKGFQGFDWTGAFIFMGSTTSIMIPLTWGGITFPWTSWHTVVPMVCGVLGLAGFVCYELKLKTAQPMIPLSIFSSWTLRVTYFGTLVHGVVLWALLYYLPVYYEAVKGYNPLMAGVAILPETFLVSPFAIVVGIIITKTGRYRWALWSGWFITTLGAALLFLLDVNTIPVSFIALNSVVSIGTGFLFPALSYSLQAATPPHLTGSAVSILVFLRIFGEAFGIALGGVVFQNQLQAQLLSYPRLADSAATLSQNAVQSIGSIKTMEDGELKQQLIQAYATALKAVWVMICGLSGLAMLASAATQGFSLEPTYVAEAVPLRRTNVEVEEGEK